MGRIMQVEERCFTRRLDPWEGWYKNEEHELPWEEACALAKSMSLQPENDCVRIQVYRNFYDMQGNYLGWDSGLTYYGGHEKEA